MAGTTGTAGTVLAVPLFKPIYGCGHKVIIIVIIIIILHVEVIVVQTVLPQSSCAVEMAEKL